MARPCRSPRSIRRSCSATPAPSTGAWPGKTSSSPNGSTTGAEPSEMIADVAFDAPVTHPFSYRVPEGWPLAPGQRVLAPLRGAVRVGMVVALREGDDARLKLLHRVADPAPILSPTRLDFVRWIAAESLSSVGSTSAALLPPPLTDSQGGGLASDAFSRNDTRTAPPARPPPPPTPRAPPRTISRGSVRGRATRGGPPPLRPPGPPSPEWGGGAGGGRAAAPPAPPGPGPAVSRADTRTVLRREPLTPVLARAVRETLAAGRRGFLALSRPTSPPACDECGTVVRCAECARALAYPRAPPALARRLC